MKSIFMLFLKLGFVAFGGPAAHTAMLEEEVVTKRKWITSQDFLELMAVTNLIPGPNSSELVMAIGYRQAGMAGLIVSGITFLIPAMLMVIVISLSLAYVDLMLLDKISLSLTPVITVVILRATSNIIKKQDLNAKGIFIIIMSLLLKYLKVEEFYIIVFGAVTYYAWDNVTNKMMTVEPFSIFLMTLYFAKIGATLYGSGYVLLSYLETTFVNQLDWITHSQMIQAFTIGEITPGPIFTTATAIGTMMGGINGGILATIGIFTPSFVMMILIMPISSKILSKKWIRTLLKGIGFASIGLMLYVATTMFYDSTQSLQLMIILIISTMLIFKYKTSIFIAIIVAPALYIILTLV